MDSPIAQPESPYEHSRRIENLARLGTVAEVRLTRPARVRVRSGKNLSGWIPWLAYRAGGSKGGRKWHPPVAGEQALVISPGGHPGQGVALLGIYSDALDQGSEDERCERTDWDDSNHWQWHDGALEIECVKSITFKVGGSTLTIKPDSIVAQAGGGTLSVAGGVVTGGGDVIGGGVSLRGHVHTGVESGKQLSGPPAGGGGVDLRNAAPGGGVVNWGGGGGGGGWGDGGKHNYGTWDEEANRLYFDGGYVDYDTGMSHYDDGSGSLIAPTEQGRQWLMDVWRQEALTGEMSPERTPTSTGQGGPNEGES